MSAECQHYCADNWKFPRRPDNRPGLSRIAYRIGTYADFREAMLRHLNQDPVLFNWTYRAADDPGIALLEGASILGDILTFYQDLYANEAYLRTAEWKESVAELVRLTGYRLSPGVGGKGTFAFEVTGTNPVTIPKGFPIKAQLDDGRSPADFESTSEVTAYPELSVFSLYRPLQDVTSIDSTTQEFYVKSSTEVELKAGDRLLMAKYCSRLWDFDRGEYSIWAMKNSEVVVIDSVLELHGETAIKIKGSLRGITSLADVVAYKLGRTFSHFGHNAPAQVINVPENASDPVTSTTIDYERKVWRGETTGDHVDPDLNADELPLDLEVDDISAGATLLCRAKFWQDESALGFTPIKAGANKEWRTLVCTAEEVTKNAYTWGSITAGVTLIKNIYDLWFVDLTSYVYYNRFDIREMQIMEALSKPLTLQVLPEAQDSSGQILYFIGTETAARALAGRSIIIRTEDDEVLERSVSRVDDPVLDFESRISAWRVVLNEAVDYSLFPHEDNETKVYGNLVVDATQGKTEKEKSIGSGDSRQTFQTFKLPKAPLTYLLDTSQTPPEVPELVIYANNREWKWVPSLFGRGPKEEVYITREDEDGTSWVQFGDGKTGARLPSGKDNVVAEYRTGVGAHGSLKEGATPQPGSRLDRLKKIYLHGQVSGGAESETGDNAKAAAPGKVQSLNRLVSLQDYETEALSISGVKKVKARWGMQAGSYVPAVLLTVLMESGQDDGSHAEVEEIMNEYNRDRGPERFAVVVEPGVFKYITVGLEIGYDGRYKTSDLESAILSALGAVTSSDTDGGTGLMSISQRTFGQREYRSRIQGVVQNVAGVVWVKVTSLAVLGMATDAGSELVKILCEPDEMLALYCDHVDITFTEAETEEVESDV